MSTEVDTMIEKHKCFTVDGTAYMRNLSRKDLHEHTWLAIHHQSPPKKTDTGYSMSMRWPVLIVADCMEEQRAIADRVALILNEHWTEEV